MLFTDTYNTIAAPVEGSYKDKGSKFYAYVFPVKTEDEVKTHLQDLWKKYHDATHICYAYIIGPGQEAIRANDDGEPANSAGKPIQRAIQSADLTNVVVFVVRYFGGTLLGIPGLISAYGNSAKLALDTAEKIECLIEYIYTIGCDYAHENDAFRLLKAQEATITGVEKTEKVIIIFAIRKLKSQLLETEVKKNPNLTILYKGIR